MTDIPVTKERLIRILENMPAGGDYLDCYILLTFARSSKTIIKQEDGEFTVINEIDDTRNDFKTAQELTESKDTNIHEALEKNAFFIFEYEKDRECVKNA